MPFGLISNTKSLIKMFLKVFKDIKKPLTHQKPKKFLDWRNLEYKWQRLVLFEKEQSLYIVSWWLHIALKVTKMNNEMHGNFIARGFEMMILSEIERDTHKI